MQVGKVESTSKFTHPTRKLPLGWSWTLPWDPETVLLYGRNSCARLTVMFSLLTFSNKPLAVGSFDAKSVAPLSNTLYVKRHL